MYSVEYFNLSIGAVRYSVDFSRHQYKNIKNQSAANLRVKQNYPSKGKESIRLRAKNTRILQPTYGTRDKCALNICKIRVKYNN